MLQKTWKYETLSRSFMFWPLTDRLPLCKSGPNTVVFPFLPFDAKRDITNALTELNWQIHSLECPLRCFDDSNPWSDSVPLENDSNGGDSVEEWMRGEGAYLRLLSRPSVIPARRLSKQMEMEIVCRSKWFQDIILKKLSWGCSPDHPWFQFQSAVCRNKWK